MGPTKYNYICQLNYNPSGKIFPNGVRADLIWRLVPLNHNPAIMAGMEYECAERLRFIERHMTVECRVRIKKDALKPEDTKFYLRNKID
jgi:hypothetical protein